MKNARRGDERKRPCTRLWVGGSSGLAETYFNNVDTFAVAASNKTDTGDHDGRQPTLRTVHWILVGMERLEPPWMPSTSETSSFEYLQCDLTQTESVQRLLQTLPADAIDQIVLSVRPPLVTHRSNPQAFRYAESLVDGLTTLLMRLVSHAQHPPLLILHVSSIAAIDHLQPQSLRSEASEPDPSSSTLKYPYDWFKRKCEEQVAAICSRKADKDDDNSRSKDKSTAYTNLRLGAIFSDCTTCIQCSALSLQAMVGPFLETPIDCNSARNVAALIHQILHRSLNMHGTLRPVYYYTRPLLLARPVPYGEYLVAYRQAHHLTYALWIPSWVVQIVVSLFHYLSEALGFMVPYLQSIDYLLQVTRHEHTFDQSVVSHDFGEGLREESILTCFERRRRQQQQLRMRRLTSRSDPVKPPAAVQPMKSE